MVDKLVWRPATNVCEERWSTNGRPCNEGFMPEAQGPACLGPEAKTCNVCAVTFQLVGTERSETTDDVRRESIGRVATRPTL